MYNVLGKPKRFSGCICRKTYESWQVKMFPDSSIKQAGSSINATYLYLGGAQYESRLRQAIMRPIILFLTPFQAFPCHIQLNT